MTESLTKEKMLQSFEFAYTQRMTIDAEKCETFGGLMQGFFGLKDGDNARLVPFMFHDNETLHEVRKAIATFETSYFAVSFVQHYIHYS